MRDRDAISMKRLLALNEETRRGGAGEYIEILAGLECMCSDPVDQIMWVLINGPTSIEKSRCGSEVLSCDTY